MALPREHLQHAPIAEALVDFRVRPRNGLVTAVFDPLVAAIRPRFPNQSPMIAFEAQFGVVAGKPLAPQATEAAAGWVVRSSEAGAVAQFRLDGFTYSKLRPYTSWDEVFESAIELWRSYVELAAPPEVARIGVRYINQLELPAGELSDFLTAAPVAPPDVTQNLREFLSRVVVWDAGRGATAIITQALGTPLAPDRVRVLLDIDVFREGAFSPKSEELARLFQPLHNLKNEIF
ncbi:MAG TPA: TIGR04255 family protein, partial [Chloroflexota bacterium]|nr:TIGR04255 family protein [Chloroflexota bacterium]